MGEKCLGKLTRQRGRAPSALTRPPSTAGLPFSPPCAPPPLRCYWPTLATPLALAEPLGPTGMVATRNPRSS